jgi:dienelactone hydrolase
MWARYGWIDRLKQDFTVVTMDFRGCGSSGKPEEPNAYTAEAHCRDIDIVLTSIGTDNPLVWGWSLGATVALHYAKRGSAKLTVGAGTYFGPIFTDSYIDKQLVMAADPVTKARLNGLRKWPIIQPADIKNPFLVYTGTEDGNIYLQIEKQRQEIIEAGGIVQILQGVNHEGLVKKVAETDFLITSFIRQRIRN